ncbi:hypothetical protein CBL_00979 [Carabus blaptoides fortunei]
MQWCVVLLLVTAVLPGYILGLPLTDDQTLVVTGDRAAPSDVDELTPEPSPPQLKSMHVDSHIRNRYARTVVSSKYLNPDDRSQETTFSIVLPDTAFISGFVMEIKGKKYEAYVREKEEAKREYQQAVSQGFGAAHVAVSARDSNKFTVSVNVEPLSKVTFNLTYEELLVRKHGEYEVVINLHPGQLVADLAVNVHLNETRKITEVKTPPLRSGNKITDSDTTETSISTKTEHVDQDGKVVNVQFTPTIQEQKQMIKTLGGDDENKGIAGQFVVTYKVEQEPAGGEVLVNDGYFVHFFAPEDLQPLAKHVVFVLDVSGSMSGRKIAQLREAMKSILNDLKEGDYFNIVKFHSDVQVLNEKHAWQDLEVPEESKLPPAVPVNKENIDQAQKIVEHMQDEGLTNIYDALLVALRLTAKGTPKGEDTQVAPQPIIVFLTDGEANVKISSTEGIVDMVETKNTGPQKAAIFALGFGRGANKDLLKKLALKNSGFMRTIYEAADASLQLQDFYKQISSPLLTNVNFKYADGQAKSVTKHRFDILFKGSELVVAGRVENPTEKFVAVDGGTAAGHKKYFPIILRPEVREEYGSLERLWAYLTIKQLLDKKYEQKPDTDTTGDKEDTPEKQALKLALKYSFVTPVTSLVVVKPNDTKSESGLENTENTRPQYFARPSYAFAGAPAPGVYYTTPLSIPMIAGGQANPIGLSGIAPVFSLQSTPVIRPQFTFQPTTITDAVRPLSSMEPTTTTPRSTLQDLVAELAWLAAHTVPTDKIEIDHKHYELGNNQTHVQTTPCQVQHLQLSGTCTLLSACPKVYPRLDSFDTYKEKFFCSLDSDRYAGVCCVD